MSKVQNNSIQTGYGKTTAGGASSDQSHTAANRNGASENNAFKDPFASISPATTTKFDFKKVTDHGRTLAENARKKRESHPDYGQTNEDGSLKEWADLDKEYRPDQKTAANRDNHLEKQAFEQKFQPEAGLSVLQSNNEEDKKSKATKPAQETLVASHDFDKQKAKSGAANGSSDTAMKA